MVTFTSELDMENFAARTEITVKAGITADRTVGTKGTGENASSVDDGCPPSPEVTGPQKEPQGGRPNTRKQTPLRKSLARKRRRRQRCRARVEKRSATEHDLDEWTTQLQQAQKDATTTLEPPPLTQFVEKYLAHLWEIHNSLEGRWRKNRRGLKNKLNNIRKEIESYAASLARNHCLETCGGLKGQLSTYYWHILKALLNPTNTKTQTANYKTKVITDAGLSKDEICRILRAICISPPSRKASPLHPIREYSMAP
ncbi:hypothetical protein HPB48_018317 [Haemaphysalis longicornis]|uniref:Uncharacterized protein n=1 Tax=Haemaphysalis longicornis TaxID=44386 RepID=A0A9J6GUR0_HAELO|nr:hypothetical protein HPB48_018317 [Haemaphysalis longicornis]